MKVEAKAVELKTAKKGYTDILIVCLIACWLLLFKKEKGKKNHDGNPK